MVCLMLRTLEWTGVLSLIVLICLPGHAPGGQPAARDEAPVYGYRVVNAYPHDPKAFTQGLLYRNGFLYESTGRRGLSSLRKVRIETGAVVQERRIEAGYWAEGLTDWKERLIQLTWQSNVAFVYDLAAFDLQRKFRYPGQGWGLTHDGTRLIMSDGSHHLRLLDPESFRELGRLAVKDGGLPVGRLNELEYVKGEIYANVWCTDRIARISPVSGQVLGWIDLTGLLPLVCNPGEPDAVLNGIAYDAENDRLFVTGKLWPRLFEIEVIHR